MKIPRRYTIVYTLLRPFFRLYTWLVYRYHAVPAPPIGLDQPALILSNHNGNLDPFFMALSFRRPIFFVASDHIFRLGWISKIIRFLVAPIPIVKSQMDLRTLREIRQVIGAGGLVGLFPEGNRSFNGETTYIAPSIGKLAKQLKCPVLLYRLDGGYLTTPRWGRHRRRGRMQGQVVRILDTQTLSGMDPDEIYTLICSDLHVDAYAQQQAQRIRYRGKRLAERLELALFICPRCKSLATLTSNNDLFSCPCGLTVRYTEHGFFEPVDAWSLSQREQGRFFDTVLLWDQWQRQYLPEALLGSGHEGSRDKTDDPGLIFTDSGETLYLAERAERSVPISTGTLTLSRDALYFRDSTGTIRDGVTVAGSENAAQDRSGSVYSADAGTLRFPVSAISRMIVHGQQALQFTTDSGQVWEVRSSRKRSAYKYLLAYHVLYQHLKGESHGFFGI